MATKFNGIAFPFAKSSTAFPATVSDDELIRQSIIQIIMTSKGERVMRPDYGSNAQSFVFANSNNILAQLIEMDVRTAISKFEPRVTVQTVVTEAKDTGVSITVNYIVNSTGSSGSASASISTSQI